MVPEHVERRRSLTVMGSAPFAGALVTRPHGRRDGVEATVERGARPDDSSAWVRSFAGEGLALVCPALRRSMTTEHRHPRVLAVVRLASRRKLEPHAWRTRGAPRAVSRGQGLLGSTRSHEPTTRAQRMGDSMPHA